MTTIISFIIVLGILIFIHELGHFMMAKLCGVGVEKFSLGFGPKLVGIKRGETEYRVSLLPLGGYVKMVGEAPGEEVSDEVREKSFTHKSVARRSAIVASGPIMNLLLMFCLMPLIYMIGVQEPAYLSEKPLVGYVEKGSHAEESGIMKGDVVRSVEGRGIERWEQLKTSIISNPGATLRLEVERAGKIVATDLDVGSSRQTGEGVAGIYPPMEPIIGALSKGYPAEMAGVKSGDRIVRIGDAEVTHWAEVQEFIRDASDELTIVIDRDGSLLTVTVKPRWNEEAGRHLIGISLLQDDFIIKQYGFIDAVGYGTKRAWELTVFTFIVIKKLFVGEISMKTLGGPIMIAQVAGQAAESGVATLLSLMAFLSLQLGILNLLPIPVLDGGHLFFFGIERLRGKPVSERVILISQQVGVALLILLMVLVTYNDILRVFGR
ncbi:MAG: RIP metalloprotease RseP [Thermodesulfobacteriota bacterium]